MKNPKLKYLGDAHCWKTSTCQDGRTPGMLYKDVHGAFHYAYDYPCGVMTTRTRLRNFVQQTRLIGWGRTGCLVGVLWKCSRKVLFRQPRHLHWCPGLPRLSPRRLSSTPRRSQHRMDGAVVVLVETPLFAMFCSSHIHTVCLLRPSSGTK